MRVPSAVYLHTPLSTSSTVSTCARALYHSTSESDLSKPLLPSCSNRHIPSQVTTLEGYSPQPLGPFFLFSSSFFADLFFLSLSFASAPACAFVVRRPCRTTPLPCAAPSPCAALWPLRHVLPLPLPHRPCCIAPLSRVTSVVSPFACRIATLHRLVWACRIMPFMHTFANHHAPPFCHTSALTCRPYPSS